MRGPRSWLLADGVALDLFNPKERLFVVDSPLYAKQCRVCKLLLLLAVQLHSRIGEGAVLTEAENTQLTEIVRTLIKPLTTPEWLRLGREYLEQVVVVLILCLPDPAGFLMRDMEELFCGARPLGLQSRLIITGVALLHLDCAEALAAYLVRNTMQGNHQLRVCAKNLLAVLLEQGKIHLDDCVAENVRAEETCSVAVPPKHIFHSLDPLRDSL